MQTSRLFEIIYILLTKKRISAKELSERLEVSTRTIYRDIDVLSGAGIPVYAMKGKGGGIMLLPEFTLDRCILSEEEKSDVLAGLQSLKAVNVPDMEGSLQKIGALLQRDEPTWIRVDFSKWDSHADEKFEVLKKGILQKRVVSFQYYNTKNEMTEREVEPIQLWFKYRAWYLQAYCKQKRGYRLFKLARMRAVSLTSVPQEIAHDIYALEKQYCSSQVYETVEHIEFEIKKSAAYRVYDEFEEAYVTEKEDGSFLIAMDTVCDHWLIGYLMTFGSELRVLYPPHLISRMKENLIEMLKQYE